MSDAEDAARWRALMKCRRLRVIGSAGFGSKVVGAGPEADPRDYRHMGVEFWTVYPEREEEKEIQAMNEIARTYLKALTDTVIRMEAISEGYCDTDTFVVFEGAPHLPVLLKGVVEPTDVQFEMARRRVEDEVGELEEDERTDFPTFDVYKAVHTGGG